MTGNWGQLMKFAMHQGSRFDTSAFRIHLNATRSPNRYVAHDGFMLRGIER